MELTTKLFEIDESGEYYENSNGRKYKKEIFELTLDNYVKKNVKNSDV